MFSLESHIGVTEVLVQSTTFKIIFSIKNTNFQKFIFKGKILVGAPLDKTCDFQFILTLTLTNCGSSNGFQTKVIFVFSSKIKTINLNTSYS